MLIPRLRANSFGNLWSSNNLLLDAPGIVSVLGPETQLEHFVGKENVFADDREKEEGREGNSVRELRIVGKIYSLPHSCAQWTPLPRDN